MNIRILSGDLTGGFIGAAIALPQALAFGSMTGAGAEAGLFGALILCVFAGIFGVKIPIISGPTGPVAIILTTVYASLGGNMAAFWAVMFLVGIFQIFLSFTKIPNLAKYVPYPVISGFMNGVGIILIVLQIPTLFGIKGFATPAMTIGNLSRILANINTEALVIGLLTLGVLVYTPKTLKKYFPVEIIALITGTLFAWLFKMNVPMVTGFDGNLPEVVTADFGNLVKVSTLAFTIAVISSVETLMTGLVATSLTKTKINNQTLIFSQGVGNAVASLFGGIAGAGATMRSAAAIKAGATTKLAAIFSGIILLIAILYGAPVVNNVPMAVLGAILVYIGWNIIDTKFLKVLPYAPKDDLVVMFIVFFLTVFYDIIFAIGAGITLSAVLFAKKLADRAEVKSVEINDSEILRLEKEVAAKSKYKIRIVHILGEFFFGSATRIISQFEELLGTKYIVLCLDHNKELDISAIFALEDILARLKEQGIRVLLVLKNDNVLKQIDKLNLQHNIKEKDVFYDEIMAIEAAKAELKEE